MCTLVTDDVIVHIYYYTYKYYGYFSVLLEVVVVVLILINNTIFFVNDFYSLHFTFSTSVYIIIETNTLKVC